MANNHSGIKEFTGDEASNLFLGQAGFHILTNGSFTIGANETITYVDGSTAHTGKNAGNYWCAIKAVDGEAIVSARSYNNSQDFSKTGAYNGDQITLSDGDIVYGAFDAITVDLNHYIIAYIGK